MTKTIQVCPQCGSDNISGIAIVEINTLRILQVEYQEGTLCSACGLENKTCAVNARTRECDEHGRHPDIDNPL